VIELVYALVQVVHNLGAVVVVASPAAALWRRGGEAMAERRLAWVLLAAWGLQAASGAGFAAASYGLKGQLPEVAGVALGALATKVAATVAGCALAAALLATGRRAGARTRTVLWSVCLLPAAAALTAAAFLRWYL
jgi:hypothetical protein